MPLPHGASGNCCLDAGILSCCCDGFGVGGDAGNSIGTRAVARGLPNVSIVDKDTGSANGIAVLIEDAAADPGDLSDSRSDGVVDHEQVVILIERKMVRVVRTDRLIRR